MLKIYNTLKHKIEEIKPLKQGEIKIYTCGPTVYDYQHIGNFTSYIRADVLRRTLEYLGYEVKMVVNITDVGHLTSDADAGEDKIEKSARLHGKSVKEITGFYENKFLADSKKLNIEPATVYPRASEHINEQIKMAKILEKKGYLYRTSDGLYFDTSRLSDYGKLIGMDKQNLLEGARVERNPEKRNPTDFAIWKFEPKGEKRLQVWESPWGKRTFPGWHLECSAMGTKYLGDKFDIHTGGVDHIGVHHTNEIAQNEATFGHPVVNYWVHFEHLLQDGHKMSKSKGGFITIDTLIDKGYSPLAFRYLVLTSGYRHKLNFTWKSMESAQNSLNGLYEQIEAIRTSKKGKVIKEYKTKFTDAIENNLDTAKALAILREVIKSEGGKVDKYATILDFDQVLGLNLDKKSIFKVPEEVQSKVHKMDEARSSKQYDIADVLRKEIENMGYKVENTHDGSKIKKI